MRVRVRVRVLSTGHTHKRAHTDASWAQGLASGDPRLCAMFRYWSTIRVCVFRVSWVSAPLPLPRLRVLCKCKSYSAWSRKHTFSVYTRLPSSSRWYLHPPQQGRQAYRKGERTLPRHTTGIDRNVRRQASRFLSKQQRLLVCNFLVFCYRLWPNSQGA